MSLTQIGGGGLESYDIIYATATDDLGATGTTDIVNVTETGVLLVIPFVCTVGITGTLTSVLEIVVDGGTTRTINVYTASSSWDAAGIGVWNLGVQNIVGATAKDHGVITIVSRYSSSLRVSHNISSAASSGTIRFGVLRGTKL